MGQGNLAEALQGLTAAQLRRLVARAPDAPLFAHAYAFHLNFRLGQMAPPDLLHWSAAKGLRGVKIHVEDGEARSLLHHPAGRAGFGALARDLGQEVHVETSSTSRADLAAATTIAHATGATQLRCYPRHSGPLSQVLARTLQDLRQLPALDPTGRLNFTLEQHEDLTSAELVGLIAHAANPRLTLLFDFANMVNAGEMPLQALATMAPHVTDVHIKDAHILPDRGGMAHRACATGQGDIPLAALMARLLVLGDDAPQIRAFALEEEADYYAPAFRFPGEGPDPIIPARAMSSTAPGDAPLAERLKRERDDAAAQLRYVRNLLRTLQTAAQAALERS